MLARNHLIKRCESFSSQFITRKPNGGEWRLSEPAQLDIVETDPPTAILDTSATAHMPDVLEMPYRPLVVGAGQPSEWAYTYRLGGLTCLASDVIGEYSFQEPLVPSRKLVFLDMAHYTSVKNTWFNGVRMPSLVLYDNGEYRLQRAFHYRDYCDRLS